MIENPTDAPVRLRIEMRPALRWAEFTRPFFAGDDPAALLAEYAAEVTLPPPAGQEASSDRPPGRR